MTISPAPKRDQATSSFRSRSRHPGASLRLRHLSRAFAASAVSAGMIGCGVLPAANATTQDDKHYGYAWVKVCQYVKYHDGDQSYEGSYRVDSYYDDDEDSDKHWTFDIHGWKTCHGEIKVNVGEIKVTVEEAPEGVDYDDESVTFDVHKGYTYTVTAYYTDDDHDHDRDLVLAAQG
jgi:hypothetical protein